MIKLLFLLPLAFLVLLIPHAEAQSPTALTLTLNATTSHETFNTKAQFGACSNVSQTGTTEDKQNGITDIYTVNNSCSTAIWSFNTSATPDLDIVITGVTIEGLQTHGLGSPLVDSCNVAFNNQPFNEASKFQAMTYNYYQDNLLEVVSNTTECNVGGGWGPQTVSSQHYAAIKDLITSEGNELHLVIGAQPSASSNNRFSGLSGPTNGSDYDPVKIHIEYDPIYPDPGAVTIATNSTGSSVVLYWDKPETFNAPITNYVINFTNNGTIPNQIISDTFVTQDDEVEYTVSNIVPLLQYYFRVGVNSTNGGYNPDGNILPYVYTITPGSVQTLTSDSFSPTEIDLYWQTPQTDYPVTGYQINFTSPYGDPLTVLARNTMNNDTSATITDLDADRQYSFRVGVFTTLGFNGDGNIHNATTLNPIELGTLQLDDSNVDRVDLIFSRLDETNSTTITMDYATSINLECQYNTVLTPEWIDFPVNPVQVGDRYIAAQQFDNNKNSVVNIQCTDTNSKQSWNYIIPEYDFPLLKQIDAFRSGEHGTMGMFGNIDLVSMVVIIIAMIGFNRVNESVGIVLTTAVIGLALYFGIISLPLAFIPVIALIIMVVIVSTRKI